MFIEDLKNLVDDFTKKGLSGYIAPAEFNRAVNDASRRMFQGLFRVYEQTQELTDDLMPFLVGPTELTLDDNGKTNYPADYYHKVALRACDNDVRVLKHHQVGKVINSTLVPPTGQHPACVLYENVIQFYPKTGLTDVELTYLRLPVEAVYAADFSSGVEVFDEAASTDVEWKETQHPELARRTLDILGFMVADPEVLQATQQRFE